MPKENEPKERALSPQCFLLRKNRRLRAKFPARIQKFLTPLLLHRSERHHKAMSCRDFTKEIYRENQFGGI